MNLDVSVLIPARNEMFLTNTVEDVLSKIRGNSEIIVILDGGWANPPLPVHPRLTVVYYHESIGQRAATNQAARLARGKYVMKLDAHCSVDEGFDVKLMADCEYDWTVIPAQYNFHVFDWRCKKCGSQWYQGPPPKHCMTPKGDVKETIIENPNCDNTTDFEMVIVWQPRWNRRTEAWRFGRDLKFAYWGELKDRNADKGDIVETMSCLGACWFMHTTRYWELEGLDEGHGSWGQMGTEVACKTWLSGGRLVCNKKTWYAHMFRTQEGWGFPYENPPEAQERAREYSRRIWLKDAWPKQVRPFSWIIEKFKPIPEWHEKEDVIKPRKLRKAIVYYTNNDLDLKIMSYCMDQLVSVRGDIPISAVSLGQIPLDGHILKAKPGYLTMAKQILVGLLMTDADVIFFCEHDVLYPKDHFEFIPPRRDVYYYNTNVWKVRTSDGHGLKVDDCKQLSGICASRDLLIQHFLKRVNRIENEGYSTKMGFEPGTHNRPERIDDFKAESWQSPTPLVDFRHDKNLTPSRWNKEEFRNQKYTEGWTESEEIPGWGHLNTDTLKFS